MSDIEDLPEEILIHIFSFLNLRSKKNVRLVCKLWHDLSYALPVISQELTVIRDYNELDARFRSFSRHVNVVLNFSVLELIQRPNVQKTKFWTKFGEQVKFLEIGLYSSRGLDTYNVDCCEALLYLFQSCPNLESLTLIDYDWVVGTRRFEKLCKLIKFPKLISVRLIMGPWPVLLFLRNLSDNSPKLENIKLYFVGNIESAEEREGFLDFFCKNAMKIKVIDISHQNADAAFLNQMFGSISPLCVQLKRLAIKGGGRHLLTIAREVPNLKEMFINGYRCSDQLFKFAMRNLGQLTVISLAGAKITDSGLIALESLINLSHLNISGCRYVTESGISEALGLRIRPQIIELRLAYLHQITDSLIIEISENLPNLRNLNLESCINLSEESLQALRKNSLQLQCLSVRGCKNLKNFTVGPTLDTWSELRHLNVVDSGMTLPKLKRLKLPKLEVIDFSKAEFADFNQMKGVFPGCPNLSEANLHLRCKADTVRCKYVKKFTTILLCHSSPLGSCYEVENSEFYTADDDSDDGQGTAHGGNEDESTDDDNDDD